MGISDPAFRYMLEKVAPLRLGPSCVTLGRQGVAIKLEQALALAADAGLIERKGPDEVLFPVGHPYLATLDSRGSSDRSGLITDIALMNLLGFAEVRSIDVSAYQGADLVMDLNDPIAAESLGRKFQFVLDGGTVEHVFHLPNALKNIFDLLETGGCVLHMSPMSNYVDHGFYQFSPTLFYDYYRVNGFTILDSTCFQHERLNINAPYKFIPYAPGSFDKLCFGGFDDKMYGIAFLARKDSGSTWNVIPQQSYYAREAAWQSARKSSK